MTVRNNSVTILGVGITSIMVALKLIQNGYKITIYTKGADPRIDREAEQYSSTGNGHAGRFITGLEGGPYLSNNGTDTDMRWAFQHTVAEGGWLAKPVTEFSEIDQEWLLKRLKVTKDQKVVKKLLENYYIRHNRESITAWQNLYKTHTFLFQKTSITDPHAGVLMLYENKKTFEAAVLLNKKYGLLKEKLSAKKINKRLSAFDQACAKGFIAGGVITEGFSLNIHQFIDNSISFLEAKGVIFFWDTEITKIEIDKKQVVQGLRTKNNELIISEHYSINPGAYGMNLLKTSPAKNKLCGVAGRWVIIPRPDGLNMPIKIYCDKRPGFPATDNNLTPFLKDGQSMFAVSGGYVYVGSNEKEYQDQDAYKIIDSENDRVLERFIGKFYQLAKEQKKVLFWHRTCVRSFTCDDNPLHETLKTSRGGFLTLTAGTNTGTTTIAPYLSDWTMQIFNKQILTK